MTPHTKANVSEIIALAWSDKVSMQAIHYQYHLTEAEVISIMRQSLKPVASKGGVKEFINSQF